MQQGKRKKRGTRTVASLCVLIALLLTLAGASLAWLVNIMSPTPKEDFYASSIAAYFAGGDGLTRETAYLITEPVHLYNLAWLQYLGIFNEVDAEGNIKQQYYFRVENDIDMDGLILPPIGTTEHPFVGNFNGNHKVITGATVSNYLAATQGDGGIEQAPPSVHRYDNTIKVGNATEEGAIVGFFGVMGNWDGSIKGLAVESTDQTDITQKVNAVYNFFLADLTVRSDTAESLMGLLAGYVDGSMGNVGIGDSRLELRENVAALNIADSPFQMQQMVSEFSLIGLYDGATVEWVDKPTGSGDGPVSPDPGPGTGGDEGDGAAWGGSIDMMELNRRLTYILGAYAQQSAYSPAISTRFLDFVGSYSSKTNIYTTSGALCYFYEGTHMPLNVDTDTMFSAEVSGNNNAKTTAYYQGSANNIAWRCEVCGTEYIGENYSASSTCTGVTGDTHDAQTLYHAEKENALNNTGYLVGGGTSANTSFIRSRAYNMTKGSYAIYRAFGKTAADSTAAQYNKGSFQMLTIDVNGNTYLIDDDDNTVNAGVFNTSSVSGKYTGGLTFAGTKTCSATDTTKWLKKYYEQNADGEEIGVKSKLNAILEEQTLFHSLHFMPKIDINNLPIDEFAANILGTKKKNYQAIKGAFNFSISAPGYITAVAATNFTSNVTHSLFSLFSIERDSNNAITSATKISTIHEKKNDTTGAISYVYNLEDAQKQSGYTYTLVYNEAVQNQLIERNAVYYFEIPVNAGDFAIGCLTDEGYGAYLMYLDIGANGEASEGDGSTGVQPGPGGGVEEVPVHRMSGINFVDDVLLGSDNRDISTYPTVTLSVTVNNTTHAPITVAYERVSTASMTYQIGGDGAASCAVSSLISEGVTVSTSTSLITAQLWAVPPPTREKYSALV